MGERDMNLALRWNGDQPILSVEFESGSMQRECSLKELAFYIGMADHFFPKTMATVVIKPR